MIKIIVFILLAVTLVLLSFFIDGILELHKQEAEERKNFVRDGMEGYLDQTFGYGMVKIFKKIYDADGNVRYLIYLPHYEWFKAPKYQWYEVYNTQKGYQHSKVEG